MRTLSKLAAAFALLLTTGTGWAQKSPEVGFIRIVNGIAPGQGNVKFLIDGEDIYPEGYLLGQATGGLGLKAGGHNIEAKREGVESGSTKIDLQAGETLTLIAFAEKKTPESPDEPPKWTTKLLRLKQSDPMRGYRMALVSICDLPEVRVIANNHAKGTNDTAYVKRLAITMVDLGNAKGEAFVKDGERILTTVSTDSPGNYVVILYQDQEGKLSAISFYDPKFVIAG